MADCLVSVVSSYTLVSNHSFIKFFPGRGLGGGESSTFEICVGEGQAVLKGNESKYLAICQVCVQIVFLE